MKKEGERKMSIFNQRQKESEEEATSFARKYSLVLLEKRENTISHAKKTHWLPLPCRDMTGRRRKVARGG